MITKKMGEPWPDGDVLLITSEGNEVNYYFADDPETAAVTDLAAPKQFAKAAIKQQCQLKIVEGFYSYADGTNKLYSMTIENQINIASIVAVGAGSTTGFKSSGSIVPLSISEVKTLASDMTSHIDSTRVEKTSRYAEIDAAITKIAIDDIVARNWA